MTRTRISVGLRQAIGTAQLGSLRVCHAPATPAFGLSPRLLAGEVRPSCSLRSPVKVTWLEGKLAACYCGKAIRPDLLADEHGGQHTEKWHEGETVLRLALESHVK